MSRAETLLSERFLMPRGDTSAQAESTLRGELKLTTRLGAPLALGELGWMSTYIVDAIMIGRMPNVHAALSISASSLGNTIYYAIVFCVIGLMTGVGTLTAQAYGRGDDEDCARTLAQSMWFVLLGTPVVMLATIGCLPLLSLFGTSAEIVAETSRYLHALIWSTAPLLLYWSLRRYLQSINRVMLITVSLVTANVVNLGGDWALLYGHFGFQPMGIAGSGWATCLVRVYMAALLLVGLGISAQKSGQVYRMAFLQPDLSRLRLLTRIGWPVAIEELADLGFSTYMSIVCAKLGATMLAAHQVVLDLDAFIYMVPLGISWATTARVGQNAGRGSLPGVRRSARASLILGVGFTSVAALLFAGFPRTWAGIYTNDPAVIAAAAPIFLICGFAQFGDAVNVILSYALIGLGDTRTPLLANTAVYWTIGVPLSYGLAFHGGMALTGLWLGRTIAAVMTGLTMLLVWRSRLRGAEGTRSLDRLLRLQPMHVK